MKQKDNSKKPLVYYRTMDEIRRYQKIPAADKLRWLEEGARFLHEAMPPEYKRIREKYRKGEL